MIIGGDVEFDAGMYDEIQILIEALGDWLRETQVIGDAQQAEIFNSEWGTVRPDGAIWVSQGGHARSRGLDKRVG